MNSQGHKTLKEAPHPAIVEAPVSANENKCEAGLESERDKQKRAGVVYAASCAGHVDLVETLLLGQTLGRTKKGTCGVLLAALVGAERRK